MRCIIICAYNEYPVLSAVTINDGDYIICADAGIKLAEAEKITPDEIIGDFDSLGQIPQYKNVTVLPVEKDDTDTLKCVKKAISKGFKEIIIVGGIGGRLDQTIANIQTVKYAFDMGCTVWLVDKNNRLTYLKDSSITLTPLDDFKLSVFSYSDIAENVSIKNVKYEITDYKLTNSFPIGISNEFTNNNAIVSIENGELLIVLSRDEK